MTSFFLVMLFAVGDHWALRPGNMPEKWPTLQACMNAGTGKMIDRRIAGIKLHCIEADDEADLHKIMMQNFTFDKWEPA